MLKYCLLLLDRSPLMSKPAGFLPNLGNNRGRSIAFPDRSPVLSLHQSPLPVPKRSIAQPLPMDIRNWSFRGLDCQGWDFSGRDIRGCGFRNAQLDAANFTRVIAGMSTKQQIRGIVFAFAFAFAGTGTGALAVAGAGAFAVAVAFAGAGAGVGAVAVAGAGAGAVLTRNAVDSFAEGQILLGIISSLLAIAACAFGIYTIREAFKKFKNGTGTDFSGACLRSVDFTSAILNNCKFDDAETGYVNWTDVSGVLSTIDFEYKRMQLLISRKGANGIYQDLDLSDRNLFAIDLMKANLTGSDLTNSNLQNTDLRFTNLSNAKAGGTDFSHAKLTGACIQNWTINPDTRFEGIECEHIYLTPDHSPENRRPLSGTFEPGDFQILVDKFADTLDFILRRGTDPIAFRQALSQFQRDNPEARIKAMVDLDPDRVLVQATVPDTTDKVKAYEQFQKNQATLQAANEEIRYLKGRLEEKDNSQTMMERLFIVLKPDIKVIQASTTTGDLMPQNQASGDIISVGANNSGVIGKDLKGVAGRDISGNLTITLAALAATEDPKEKELATLLEQVKKTIEAPDCELDDRYKDRALEYLDSLAKLAEEQPENRLKQAKNNLDDLADIADKGSKIATFAERYLPTFVSAIGALKLWFGIP